MNKPTEEDIDRCISEAFGMVQKDVNWWNESRAGKPGVSIIDPELTYDPVEFSHREWCIATIWNLVNGGFEIDGQVMLYVTRHTGSDKINSD